MMRGFDGGYWPGRPRPFDGESFASWFGRVAHANGLAPSELYRIAVPGAYLHSGDLDRTACADLLFELAGRTRTDVEDLATRTLAQWAGVIYGEDDGRCKLPWLPPAGTDKTRRSFGQQFCPACLRGDDVPHFRLEWRLSYVTVCERHLCFLADRCPVCAEPIHPLKAERGRGGYACAKCGGFLTAAERVPAAAKDLSVQHRFSLVAHDRWASLPDGRPLISLAFFALAMLLFRLLAGGKFARPLRDRLADDEEARRAAGLIPCVKEAERLNPQRRLQLLRMVDKLLEDWPRTFLAVCLDAGISQWHLLKRPNELPFAFVDPISRHLSFPVREVGEAELKEGKEVLRRRGEVPTYDALTDLFGSKFVAQRALAEPVGLREAWGRGRYWKLDGVDPEVRRAALDAAHRRGEKTSALVERILRDALIDAPSASRASETRRNRGCSAKSAACPGGRYVV